MKKLIGVKKLDVYSESFISNLKRDALIFDQVYSIKRLEDVKISIYISRNKHLIDEIDWLTKTGILKWKENESYSEKHIKRLEDYKTYIKMSEAESTIAHEDLIGFLNMMQEGMPTEKLAGKAESFSDKEVDFLIRAFCIALQDTKDLTAIPILSNSFSFNLNETKQSKSDIVQIIVHNMPEPTNIVPWEQILEFKRDTEARSKFLALKNWINETANGELSPNEIEEKLEYLLNQYEKHMELHKMKYYKGVFETIVTTTAEIAENLVKLKFSKIAQLPFTIKNKKIALMEEEMKAPGKEVAYISRAREEFS